MRQPRSRAELYAWHTKAVAFMVSVGVSAEAPITKLKTAWRSGVHLKQAPHIVEGDPQYGYYLYGTKRTGEQSYSDFKPASIYRAKPELDELGEMTGDEVMLCEVAGEMKPARQVWLWLAMRPISRDDYKRRVAALAFGPGPSKAVQTGTETQAGGADALAPPVRDPNSKVIPW